MNYTLTRLLLSTQQPSNKTRWPCWEASYPPQDIGPFTCSGARIIATFIDLFNNNTLFILIQHTRQSNCEHQDNTSILICNIIAFFKAWKFPLHSFWKPSWLISKNTADPSWNDLRTAIILPDSIFWVQSFHLCSQHFGVPHNQRFYFDQKNFREKHRKHPSAFPAFCHLQPILKIFPFQNIDTNVFSQRVRRAGHWGRGYHRAWPTSSLQSTDFITIDPSAPGPGVTTKFRTAQDICWD